MNTCILKGHKENTQQKTRRKPEPGDSSRDLFSPETLEVTNNLWVRVTASPSQKGHNRRIARLWSLPKSWRFVRNHDKPIHGSCVIYFPGARFTCICIGFLHHGLWLDSHLQILLPLLGKNHYPFDPRPPKHSWNLFNLRVLVNEFMLISYKYLDWNRKQIQNMQEKNIWKRPKPHWSSWESLREKQRFSMHVFLLIRFCTFQLPSLKLPFLRPWWFGWLEYDPASFLGSSNFQGIC